MKYLLNRPLCAVCRESGTLAMLPAGAILRAVSACRPDGMLDAVMEESLYSVFEVDLEQRAVLMEDGGEEFIFRAAGA